MIIMIIIMIMIIIIINTAQSEKYQSSWFTVCLCNCVTGDAVVVILVCLCNCVTGDAVVVILVCLCNCVTGDAVVVILSQSNSYHVQRARLFRQHVIDDAQSLHIVTNFVVEYAECSAHIA